VIKASGPFITAAQNSNDVDALKPGTFRLHRHMNATAAWNLLLNPLSQIQTVVTVPDGMRAKDIIALMARDTGKPLSDFQTAFADTSALGLPSYANGKVEGYLFPATYQFQPGTTPLQMLQTMVSKFNSEMTSIGLSAAAQKGNFSPGQVIIEASLLEGEVTPADYAMCARVIDNRLNQKMELQLDSTTLYALGLEGTDNLSTTQLNDPSPYNTRNHQGLPPGPIDSPDLAAISAVLHPASGNWLYFLTINLNTKQTLFTASYTQFLQWQHKYDPNG
jgi:UPF0755 protein